MQGSTEINIDFIALMKELGYLARTKTKYNGQCCGIGITSAYAIATGTYKQDITALSKLAADPDKLQRVKEYCGKDAKAGAPDEILATLAWLDNVALFHGADLPKHANFAKYNPSGGILNTQYHRAMNHKLAFMQDQKMHGDLQFGKPAIKYFTEQTFKELISIICQSDDIPIAFFIAHGEHAITVGGTAKEIYLAAHNIHLTFKREYAELFSKIDTNLRRYKGSNLAEMSPELPVSCKIIFLTKRPDTPQIKSDIFSADGIDKWLSPPGLFGNNFRWNTLLQAALIFNSPEVIKSSVQVLRSIELTPYNRQQLLSAYYKGTPGLYFALSRDHVEAVKAYIEAILDLSDDEVSCIAAPDSDSGSDSDYDSDSDSSGDFYPIFDLLSATCKKGYAGLWAALRDGCARVVRVYMESILRSHLMTESKVKLLDAKSRGESGLYIALKNNHLEAVQVYMTAVLNSNLAPEAKKNLLSAKSRYGSTGLYAALFRGNQVAASGLNKDWFSGAKSASAALGYINTVLDSQVLAPRDKLDLIEIIDGKVAITIDKGENGFLEKYVKCITTSGVGTDKVNELLPIDELKRYCKENSKRKEGYPNLYGYLEVEAKKKAVVSELEKYFNYSTRLFDHRAIRDHKDNFVARAISEIKECKKEQELKHNLMDLQREHLLRFGDNSRSRLHQLFVATSNNIFGGRATVSSAGPRPAS